MAQVVGHNTVVVHLRPKLQNLHGQIQVYYEDIYCPYSGL